MLLQQLYQRFLAPNSLHDTESGATQVTPLIQKRTLAQASLGRENNLDFLRFFLAALVVFSHSFALPGYEHWEPIRWLTRGQIDGGSLAVDAFFIVSGFLVTQSWQRSKGLGDYLKKRVLRIYPGFVVVALLCALVVGPFGAENKAAYWRALHPARFIYNTAQLQFFLPPVFTNLTFHSANGSLWTIRNEFLCYLMVAVFGLMGLYRQRSVILALFVAALGLYAREIYAHTPFCSGRILPVVGQLDMWPHYLTQYLAGMCGWLYRDRIALSARWLGLHIGIVAVAAFAVPALLAVLPLSGAILLFAFAFAPRLNLRAWGRRGDFSYGIYLYAFPIQQLLLRFLNPHIPPLALFGMSFPLTLACAVASWRGVEKPFLRLKNNHPASAETATLSI